MAQSSGPISQGTAAERQFTDVMWRDLFGDEPGVISDLDGTAYQLTLPADSDVAQVGSATQKSIAKVSAFVHTIPQGSPEPITIPAAVSERTDIIALRYDPAYTGAPGPVRLIRLEGTSAGIPTYDASPPGVEDLPLWAVNRKPGQALSQATVTRLFPRIAPSLAIAVGSPLPLSPPLDTAVRQGPTSFVRQLDAGGVPVWAKVFTTPPSPIPAIGGSFARTDNTANLNANNFTDLTAKPGVSSVGTWTEWNPGNLVGWRNVTPGRYLVTAHLLTAGSGGRWESLLLHTGAQILPIDDDGPASAYGALSGSAVIDAPDGINVGFRYQTNGAAGTIRTPSYWSCHWLQPL